MRTKDTISFLRVLNENLRLNPFYRTLFEKVGAVIDQQIGEPLAQLERIRSSMHIKRGDYLDHPGGRDKVAHIRREIIDNEPMDVITLQLMRGNSVTITKRALQDRQILVDSAYINGFDYYSDFLTDEDYARINDYVSEYWSTGGADNPGFIRFIGFIKNMRLDLTPLWSRDIGPDEDEQHDYYEYFKTIEEVTNPIQVDGSGDEFLTSHVDMEYDAFATPNPNFDDLISLFYYFAPIDLVLHRIIGSFYIEVFTYYNMTANYDVDSHTKYVWSPDGTIELGSTFVLHMDINDHDYVFLNDDLEAVDPDPLA